MDLPEDVSGADFLNIQSAGFLFLRWRLMDGHRHHPAGAIIAIIHAWLHIQTEGTQTSSQVAGIRVILHTMESKPAQ
jgi:hypothetical protein